MEEHWNRNRGSPGFGSRSGLHNSSEYWLIPRRWCPIATRVKMLTGTYNHKTTKQSFLFQCHSTVQVQKTPLSPAVRRGLRQPRILSSCNSPSPHSSPRLPPYISTGYWPLPPWGRYPWGGNMYISYRWKRQGSITCHIHQTQKEQGENEPGPRKRVFGVSDQVRYKPACAVTEEG